jgi:pyridinium-3,5-bisthiocarboxylic acid mononucleotide nickel chelatase
LKILYCDCYAGISGDMTVGALLDLGIRVEVLKDGIARLGIPSSSYAIQATEIFRRGVRATKFSVLVEEHQPHRHYADITVMIEKSALPDRARETAQRIFFRLAEAESKVHGVEIGQVHFHEVGALDSIIDIVGTAICLDHLRIDKIFASPLPLGGGFVDTAHGVLPVPAPATAELLKGLEIHHELKKGERVTPTGAAIVAALAGRSSRPDGFILEKIGCGGGDRDFEDAPNILRLFLGRSNELLAADEIRVLETHLDDMNPEVLGFVMERLLAAGALDVTLSPLQMKKNRPGVKLTILSPPMLLDTIARMVLLETSAIGVRHYPVKRTKLGRSLEERETSLGRVVVKVIREGNIPVRTAPEYEECRRIAEERGIPLLEVYAIIARETGPT